MTNSDQHPHGGQQGSTKASDRGALQLKGDVASEKAPNNRGSGKVEAGEETEERQKGGDPDNASETTGGSESGGEDKGAK